MTAAKASRCASFSAEGRRRHSGRTLKKVKPMVWRLTALAGAAAGCGSAATCSETSGVRASAMVYSFANSMVTKRPAALILPADDRENTGCSGEFHHRRYFGYGVRRGCAADGD